MKNNIQHSVLIIIIDIHVLFSDSKTMSSESFLDIRFSGTFIKVYFKLICSEFSNNKYCCNSFWGISHNIAESLMFSEEQTQFEPNTKLL